MREGAPPHRLCPEGSLQVFHDLAPHLRLLLVKGTQTLHLRPEKAQRSRWAASVPAPGTPSLPVNQGHPGLRKAAPAAKSLQPCPTLCDPIDGSPPGSPVPGILWNTGVGFRKAEAPPNGLLRQECQALRRPRFQSWASLSSSVKWGE